MNPLAFEEAPLQQEDVPSILQITLEDAKVVFGMPKTSKCAHKLFVTERVPNNLPFSL